MPELCDLKIHVNGQQTFFLNQKIVSKYSARLKKFIIRRGKRSRTQIGNPGIQIHDFPGGPDGFELVFRFCYSDGGIEVNPSNVCLLHCCALFLEMTEEVSAHNLLRRTASFLEGMADWSWGDALLCLKSCESFLQLAESCGLAQKLIAPILGKISPASSSGRSSSSSPSSTETTSSDRFAPASSSSSSTSPGKAWWFDDLTVLPPNIMKMIFKSLGACGHSFNSGAPLLTRFLLHYLKRANHGGKWSTEYAALAETAVCGVVRGGGGGFSSRGLFSVLRVGTSFGVSRGWRDGLEALIGGRVDQATLDDLLVGDGGARRGVYDVNLVRRLIRVFVNGGGEVDEMKMKKVGRLVDKYLGEIAPDQRLEVLKFLGVAESLPDCARDCFDGVYRAIDIYLQSHPNLPFEERSKLCRCLNYEKLSLEACKDLAKNPRIPPRIAIQALMSQSQRVTNALPSYQDDGALAVMESPCKSKPNITLPYHISIDDAESSSSEESKGLRLNLQRMQWRVVELEKVCRDMKGQMSRLIKNTASSPSYQRRTLPKLC